MFVVRVSTRTCGLPERLALDRVTVRVHISVWIHVFVHTCEYMRNTRLLYASQWGKYLLVSYHLLPNVHHGASSNMPAALRPLESYPDIPQ